MTRNYKPRNCERCAAQFAPTGPRARYCASCAPVAHREADARSRSRNREKNAARFRERYHADPEFRAAKQAYNREHSRERYYYNPERERQRNESPQRREQRRAAQARYKTTPAGRATEHAYKHTRRAKERGASAEPIRDIEIFDRDGWTCQLCGEPIDRVAKWPDPASASLDHITPLAMGGHHSRDNVQASHLGCNIRKGARLDVAV